MKVVVFGGGGAMGRVVVQDLVECPDVTGILVADYNEGKAREVAERFKDKRVQSCFADATKVEEVAKIFKGYAAVINCAQYDVNLQVMEACVKAGCHYNDLGGMFHMTKKQLKLFDDFKKAGLTAVLGMGAAPGITNVLSRYACDRLDEVSEIRCQVGISPVADEPKEVFWPAYSIRTIMEEYADDSQQFINGRYQTMPPMSGFLEVEFPAPVGRKLCMHTLHSEPATIPDSFKDKGVKNVTWRLGLPAWFEEKAQFLAKLGFAGKEPVVVQGTKVIPREMLATIIEKQLQAKKLPSAPETVACIQAHAFGKKGGRLVECIVSCLVGVHSRWKMNCMTSTPPAIVAQMQAKGMIEQPGVWGPEKVIDPEYFFKELGKREMQVLVTLKERLV
jgi:saccharopine dehydrogenase-like NADP-dependent oxidoreductase